jgi:hypothetical protein
MKLRSGLIAQLERARVRFFAKSRLADSAIHGMGTPCLEWMACRDRDGYGQFRIAGKQYKAHRAAWLLANGQVPEGLCVLHRCDNPGCVRLDHLFLGTSADNIADRDAKGRQSQGDAHYARKHPEWLARGDANGSRTHPERLARGERHGSRLHPDRISRGHVHSQRMKEVAARGCANGAYIHPESRRRGSLNGRARLDESAIPVIFRLRKEGLLQRQIAERLGVSRVQVAKVLSRKAWRHVSVE